ncbi:hypothetical protein EVAR_60403_1 [Eumeta japonica]|uniref:Uncharacterized protein n=1 Tax=Eumeta variegata TaxID=151549 RepID=A0A4C1YMN0_EUMVA|nr:hypothetical protein EVAR_60403_1 [Eumeta japonica]
MKHQGVAHAASTRNSRTTSCRKRAPLRREDAPSCLFPVVVFPPCPLDAFVRRYTAPRLTPTFPFQCSIIDAISDHRRSTGTLDLDQVVGPPS